LNLNLHLAVEFDKNNPFSADWVLAAAFLLLFCLDSARAQDLGGYLFSKGDTVKGTFKNRPDELYTTVRFKAKSADVFTTYTPAEVDSFYMESVGKFVSFSVMNAERPDIKAKRFLFTLEEGAVRLFLLNDEEKTRMFVRKGNAFHELDKVEKLAQNASGQTVKRTTNRYKGILNVVFSDCPQKVDDLKLDKDEIRNAVINYNKCRQPSHVASTAPKPASFRRPVLVSS
jgi:hypothetical protein